MKANVSKMLRSALSMFLALAMVIGMVPAAFAAEVPTGESLNAKLEQLVSVLEAGPDGVNAAIDYAKENRDAIEAEVEELRSELAKALDDAEKLANEELDALVKLSEELLVELQAQVDALQAELDEKVAELEEAEETLAEYEELAAEAQAELDAKKAEVEAAETVTPELEQELADAQAKLDEKTAELADAQEMVAEAEEMVDLAQTAIDKVNEAIPVVEAALPKAEALIEEILATRMTLREAILDLDNMVVEMLGEIDNVVAQTIAANKGALEEAAKAIEEAKAVVKDVLAQLEAGTTTVEQLMEDLVNQAVEANPLIAVACKEAVDAVKDYLAENKPEESEIEALNAKLQAALEEAEAAAKELYAEANAYYEKYGRAVNARVENVIAVWKQAYYDATNDDYLINTDSYYVAVGDATAAGDSYVVDLYEELLKDGLPTGAYANAASSSVVYAKDIASQIPAVANADLITVGLGNITFLQNAVAAISEGDFAEETYAKGCMLDWGTVDGEWMDYEVIAPIFMEIYEGLWLYEGMNKQVAAIITAALEAYAYSIAAYAVQVPALINDIHSVNPYAVVVLVGMYNPLDGFTVDGVNVGQYIDILVEAASIHGKAYAMLTGNAIYVDAPAVETAGEFSIEAVLKNNDYSALLPSAAGHKYIQTCIYEALGLYNPVVMRVYGETRYETALAAANTMLDVTGAEKFDTIVVATGRDFADALAGSYLAAEMNAPILLVKDSKADMVAAYIAENLAADGTVYVLGGEDAVSAATAAKLGNVVRLAGKDRYATNLQILAEAGMNGGELLVATGKNYADALSASSTGKPILLVSSALKAEQKEFLAASGVEKITILGGNEAVSVEVEAELAAYAPVGRIGGATRYETSAMIADYFFGGRNGSVVVATGRDYADALAGGALAAAAGVPVVLTKHGGITVADDYAVKAELGVVLGGEATGITKQDIVDIFELITVADITEVIYG